LLDGSKMDGGKGVSEVEKDHVRTSGIKAVFAIFYSDSALIISGIQQPKFLQTQ